MDYYQPKQRRKMYNRYARGRSSWRRLHRLLFPSPLETSFARAMRGHTLTIPFIKSKRTGFCLTFIRRGRILKRELMHREVRAGPYFIDWAVVTPFYKRGIELHSKAWHRDVVKDQERDEYLKAHGWTVRYVTAKHLAEPMRLYVEILRFLKQ